MGSGENAPDRSPRAYVIEPQSIFIPYLARLLTEAGLEVVGANRQLDEHHMAAHEPELIFVDLDFLEKGELNTLRQLRQLAPNASILAYVGNQKTSFAASCHVAGANAVFSKRVGEQELRDGIRHVLEQGFYIDRFLFERFESLL